METGHGQRPSGQGEALSYAEALSCAINELSVTTLTATVKTGREVSWELGVAPWDERGTACGLERVMLEAR
jgi:hypothetical protein